MNKKDQQKLNNTIKDYNNGKISFAKAFGILFALGFLVREILILLGR